MPAPSMAYAAGGRTRPRSAQRFLGEASELRETAARSPRYALYMTAEPALR